MILYVIAAWCGLMAAVGLYSAAVVMVFAIGRPFVFRWRRHGWGARAPRTRLIENTPGVYVMLWGPIPMYAGQTIDPAARMIGHGKDTRALLWTHGAFIPWPDGDLDEPERFLIRAFPWVRLFGMNKTRGGS